MPFYYANWTDRNTGEALDLVKCPGINTHICFKSDSEAVGYFTDIETEDRYVCSVYLATGAEFRDICVYEAKPKANIGKVKIRQRSFYIHESGNIRTLTDDIISGNSNTTIDVRIANRILFPNGVREYKWCRVTTMNAPSDISHMFCKTTIRNAFTTYGCYFINVFDRGGKQHSFDMTSNDAWFLFGNEFLPEHKEGASSIFYIDAQAIV